MPSNWKNAADHQPKDNQSVLISVNGIYYDAIYKKDKDLYKPKKFDLLQFPVKIFTVYWREVDPPQEKGKTSSKKSGGRSKKSES